MPRYNLRVRKPPAKARKRPAKVGPPDEKEAYAGEEAYDDEAYDASGSESDASGDSASDAPSRAASDGSNSANSEHAESGDPEDGDLEDGDLEDGDHEGSVEDDDRENGDVDDEDEAADEDEDGKTATGDDVDEGNDETGDENDGSDAGEEDDEDDEDDIEEEDDEEEDETYVESPAEKAEFMVELLQASAQHVLNERRADRRLALRRPLLKELRRELRARQPSLKRILDAPVSRAKKLQALEMFEIFRTEGGAETREGCRLAHRINALLDEGAGLSAAEAARYERETERLLAAPDGGAAHRSVSRRIVDLEAPDRTKRELFRMYDRIQRFDAESELQTALKAKLRWALELPHDRIRAPLAPGADRAAINTFCAEVQRKLDERLYGMTHIKEAFLELAVNQIARPGCRHPNLALKGKPGVGKTMVCEAFADALGLPFERIPLGGLKDASILKGNDSVWIGSEPSVILRALRKMGCANGVILFDEIDKIADCFDIESALLHITDPTQNCTFEDNYLSEFPHNISRLIFLFAMNRDDTLLPALRDRLHVLEVPAYSAPAKAEILEHYLLPKALANLGMAPGSVALAPDAVAAVLEKHGRADAAPESSGVRGLDRGIGRVVSRLNYLHHITLPDGTTGALAPSFAVPPFAFPLTLTRAHIDALWCDEPTDTGYLRMFS